MRGATGRFYTIGFGLIAALVLGGAVVALMRLHSLGAVEPLWLGGAMGLLIAVMMGLWSLHGMVETHLLTLERLRAGLHAVGAMAPGMERGERSRLAAAVLRVWRGGAGLAEGGFSASGGGDAAECVRGLT